MLYCVPLLAYRLYVSLEGLCLCRWCNVWRNKWMKIFIFSHFCLHFCCKEASPLRVRSLFSLSDAAFLVRTENWPCSCFSWKQYCWRTQRLYRMVDALYSVLHTHTHTERHTHTHTGQCLKNTHTHTKKDSAWNVQLVKVHLLIYCKSSFTDLFVYIMLRANAVLRKLS